MRNVGRKEIMYIMVIVKRIWVVLMWVFLDVFIKWDLVLVGDSVLLFGLVVYLFFEFVLVFFLIFVMLIGDIFIVCFLGNFLFVRELFRLELFMFVFVIGVFFIFFILVFRVFFMG